MNDRTFADFFRRREATGAVQSSAADGNATTAKGGSFASNAVQVNSQTGALSVAAFYRAVELRANTMAQLVMQYQRVNNRHGGNYEQDNRGEGGRLNYLLQVQPNPTMTWAQLVKQAEQLRIFDGNAVIYIEKSGGEVVALWLAYNATLDRVTHKYNFQYNRPGGVCQMLGVDPIDVLHIRNTFSNDYGLTGVSTLQYARKALSLAATNDKLVLDTAAKGMRQKLLVQEDKQGGFGLGKANKRELEKVTNQLDQDIADKDVILLNNIATVTPISTNLQQQEINQIRQFSVAEVARYMGVPKIMLMSSENESYKTPEAATQEFLLRTIQPLSHDWEMEMNAKLLGQNGYPVHRYHFDDASLMRLDPMGRANLCKVMIETGIKCVNELRAEYDLPEVKGGDAHYISTNLQRIDAPKVVEDVTVEEEGGQG